MEFHECRVCGERIAAAVTGDPATGFSCRTPPLTLPDAAEIWKGITPAPEQAAAVTAIAEHRVLVITGGPGCIDASTKLQFESDARRGKGGRWYTVEDAYHKFHGIHRPGAGKGRNRFWCGGVRTLSMNADGAVGYNRVMNIVATGMKPVFDVRSEGGRRLLITAEHPFKVPDGTPGADEEGYKPLERLAVGDLVVGRREAVKPATTRGKNSKYRPETHVPYHPKARTKRVLSRGRVYTYRLVRNARLVLEAELNGLPLEQLVRCLQSSSLASTLEFLPPNVEVHHKNGDPTDDRPTNLEALSKAEHARRHGGENRQHFGNQQTEVDSITSITPLGVRPVYDLVMADPDRNYVAGGFVVHNCGKTATLSAVLEVLEHNGIDTACCAPTGKAAQRMKEQTGREAMTIHRLLGYVPGQGFRHDDGEVAYDESGRVAGGPLDVGAVVVDESSMVDTGLFHALVRAIPDNARLIIVGDVDQLPSIGAGRVLHDVIESGIVPVCRLSRIFRQASESRIPYVARDINHGRAPDLGAGGDVMFIGEDHPETLADCIVKAVGTVLPSANPARGRRAYDPISEVQVMAPQKGGPIGVEQLNRALQARLNPGSDEDGLWIGGGYRARLGDRVIHVKNNYKLLVFNGEMGTVVAADFKGILEDELQDLGMVATDEDVDVISVAIDAAGRSDRVVVVEYDDRKVAYTKADVRELLLGYAITVHKSQGSQFPCVVLPVHEQHSFMLTRSLLYTGVTRASELVLLYGQGHQVVRAAQNTRGTERRTTLQEQLQHAMSDEQSSPDLANPDLTGPDSRVVVSDDDESRIGWFDQL